MRVPVLEKNEISHDPKFGEISGPSGAFSNVMGKSDKFDSSMKNFNVNKEEKEGKTFRRATKKRSVFSVCVRACVCVLMV